MSRRLSSVAIVLFIGLIRACGALSAAADTGEVSGCDAVPLASSTYLFASYGVCHTETALQCTRDVDEIPRKRFVHRAFFSQKLASLLHSRLDTTLGVSFAPFFC